MKMNWLPTSLLVLSGLLIYGFQASAETPILSIPTPSRDNSLKTYVLRDGNSSLVEEVSTPDIESLTEKLEIAEKAADEDKNRTPKELENILIKLNRLIEAIEDMSIKKTGGKLPTREELAIVSSSKSKKDRVLENLLLTSKKNPDKNAYFKFQQAANNSNSSLSTQAFIELTKDKKTPNSIKNRAQAILLIDQLRSESKVKNIGALKSLISSQNSLVEKSNLAAQLAIHLSFARSLAGIADSTRVRSPDPLYRQYLNKAAKNTAGISKVLKDKVVYELIWIWRLAEPSASWFQIPFDLSVIRNQDTLAAINERKSLEIYAKGKVDTAIQITRSLEELFETKTPWRARLVNWQKLNWQKTKNYKSFEFELIRQIDLEKSPERLSKLKQEYLGIVKSEASKVKSSPQAGRQTIALADRYIEKTNPMAQHRADITELTGSIFGAIGDFKQAGVRFFMASEGNEKSDQKLRLLRLAIKNQERIAKWPTTPPWFQIPKGDKTERSLLRKYYLAVLTLTPLSWPDSSHVGLLDISLDSGSAAFKRWSDLIEKSPSGIHANNAAWLMATTYELGKSWDELETLSRQLIKVGLNPNAKNRRLNSNDLLALALYEGGMKAFKAANYAKTNTKLIEYVDKFAKPNEDIALWVLANSLHLSQNYSDSITRAHDLVVRFRSSKIWLEANYTAFSWAEDLGFEAFMLNFANNYLSKDLKSSKAITIRGRLIKLLIGIERYGEAITRLKEQIRSGMISKEEETQLSYQIMHLADLYGKTDVAASYADEFLRKGGANWQKADAYGIKGKYLAEKNDIAALDKLEKQVAALNGEDFIFVQKTSQMKYRIAASFSTAPLFEPVTNISLKDPKSALKAKIDLFTNYERRMKSVCASGSTGYCALALIKIANTGKEFIPVLEGIHINPTLGDEETVPYDQYKKANIARIEATIIDCEKKAYDIVIDGESDPVTALDVIWRTSSDWNFDPVTGSQGRGFVQLQATKGPN
jgi:hypothetical protein